MAVRDTILVLDFGSPYAELIARKIRENRVYSKILNFDVSPKEISDIESVRGVILSEGPQIIDEKRLTLPKKRMLKLKVPILGVNYGALIIAHLLKGKVKFGRRRQSVKTEIFIDDFSDIFYKLPANFTSEVCAEEEILKVSPHFKSIAHTLGLNSVSFSDRKNKIYGLKLHPKIFEDSKGSQILLNFLLRICNCKRIWSEEVFIKEKTQEIKKIVGKKKVIVGLDGRLNSAVCAGLISKSIGRNLKCLFIDSGFFYDSRKDQVKLAREVFKRDLHLNLIYIDKRKHFLNRLKGVIPSEAKKRILEEEYRFIFENEAKKIKNLEFLGLPTLYSEKKIRSPLLLKRKLKVIEPLKELFSDEIKKIAQKLGFPEFFIQMREIPPHQIPLRIKGEVTKENLKILQEAEIRIFDEIERSNLTDIKEIFAVFIPLAGENILVIHCLSSSEGKPLEWSKLPYEILEKISKKIKAEVKKIDHIVYSITP